MNNGLSPFASVWDYELRQELIPHRVEHFPGLHYEITVDHLPAVAYGYLQMEWREGPLATLSMVRSGYDAQTRAYEYV